MSVHARIEQLELRHRNLDSELDALHSRPSVAPEELTELKLQKLRLKDEIMRLQSDQH